VGGCTEKEKVPKESVSVESFFSGPLRNTLTSFKGVIVIESDMIPETKEASNKDTIDTNTNNRYFIINFLPLVDNNGGKPVPP
jgi:hypothetical protein